MITFLVPGLLALSNAADAQVPVSTPPPQQGGSAERAGGPLGLGVGIGAPSGLTGKMWLGDWSGVQFSAGGDAGRLGDVAVTVDYVAHLRPIQPPTESVSIPLHIGVGVNLSTNITEMTGTLTTGPRLVLGASIMVRDVPADFFMETAPTFYFYELLTWSFDGQMGVRYYF